MIVIQALLVLIFCVYFFAENVSSEDGLYEIEICENVGATNLFKRKDETTLSGFQKEISKLNKINWFIRL